MKKYHNIFRAIVLLMTVIILAAHVVPTSLNFLNPEFCFNENFSDSEVEEEEKKLVRLSNSNEIIGVLNSLFYANHFEVLPPSPHRETHFPPPDFT